jgi:hypothetical protein
LHLGGAINVLRGGGRKRIDCLGMCQRLGADP